MDWQKYKIIFRSLNAQYNYSQILLKNILSIDIFSYQKVY
jgi:hypothetical protein